MSVVLCTPAEHPLGCSGPLERTEELQEHFIIQSDVMFAVLSVMLTNKSLDWHRNYRAVVEEIREFYLSNFEKVWIDQIVNHQQQAGESGTEDSQPPSSQAVACAVTFCPNTLSTFASVISGASGSW